MNHDRHTLAFILTILEDQREHAITVAFRESCDRAIELAKRLIEAKAASQAEAVSP